MKRLWLAFSLFVSNYQYLSCLSTLNFSGAKTAKARRSMTPNSDDIIPTTTTTITNNKQHVEAAVEYAKICGGLKRTKRTGWVYRKVQDPESVADHSWRVAALCLLLLDEKRNSDACDITKEEEESASNSIDVAKCIQLAVVHDLAEAIVGDIAPADNVSKTEKARMEEEAIITISDKLSVYKEGAGDYLLHLFEEYEARESREAIAVKDLDLLDMIIQADEYECEAFSSCNNGSSPLDLQEFFDGTGVKRFQNECIRDVAAEVHRQRNERVRASSATSKEENFVMSPSPSGTAGNPSSTKNINHGSSSPSAFSLPLEDEQFVSDYCVTYGQDYDVVANIVSALRIKDED